jgi:hypothetical protein
MLSMMIAGGMNSCFVVKYSNNDDIAPEINLTEKPKIKMSDEIIRSQSGDMIAYIPFDWFFVDMDDKLNVDVVSVAVNPKYNMSLVVSKLPKSDKISKIEDDDDLIDLARYSFSLHKKQTKDALKLAGKYRIINTGSHKFASYSSSVAGGITSHSIVFQSQLQNLYEVSLVPMMVNGNPVPDKTKMQEIFDSIVLSVQY